MAGFQRLLFHTVLLAGLFCSLVLPPVAGSAQAAARVQVMPAASQVGVGETVEITLEVSGGENVNAFDLSLLYNPALVTLDSWEPGDYLSNLFRVYKQEEPGLLRVAYTQLATPPVSGDGTLFRLVFRGTSEGDCDLILDDVIFADGDGNESNPQREHGILSVLPSAQPSPTFTHTLLPTAGSTQTPTPLPTAGNTTPTATLTGTSTAAIQPTWTRLPTRTMPPANFTPSPLAPRNSATPASQLTVGRQASASPAAMEPSPAATALPANPPVEAVLWGLLIAGGAAILVMLTLLAIRRGHSQSSKD